MRRMICGLVIILTAVVMGCDATLPITTSGGGWILFTNFIPLEGPIVVTPGVGLQGTWLPPDKPGAVGSASPFTVVTDLEGFAAVPNGRVPADWHIVWSSGPIPGCDGHSTTVSPALFGSTEEVDCFEEVIPVPGFSASPNPLYQNALATVLTITGSGFSSAHGMPVVQYYNLQGNLIAQETATAIASNGTWIDGPVPSSVTSVPAGAYAGVIKNANASGGFDYVGTASISVYQHPPINPGSPCKAECPASGTSVVPVGGLNKTL